jgi:hypothetical protein
VRGRTPGRDAELLDAGRDGGERGSDGDVPEVVVGLEFLDVPVGESVLGVDGRCGIFSCGCGSRFDGSSLLGGLALLALAVGDCKRKFVRLRGKSLSRTGMRECVPSSSDAETEISFGAVREAVSSSAATEA